MRIRLTLRGREVLVLEWERQNATEVLADAIAELAAPEEEPESEEDEPTMAGGSGHNFERDLTPVSPDDRYAPWDDRFGFQP